MDVEQLAGDVVDVGSKLAKGAVSGNQALRTWRFHLWTMLGGVSRKIFCGSVVCGCFLVVETV